ncbi:hypothetical protein GCM10027080_36370 [Pedococcus soli]
MMLVSARSVRSILRSQGVRDVPVEAVLMIWGLGARQLQNDWAVVDDVQVAEGVAAADEWLRHCNDGGINAARAKEPNEILRSHQAKRDAHAGAKTRHARGSAWSPRPGRPRPWES